MFHTEKRSRNTLIIIIIIIITKDSKRSCHSEVKSGYSCDWEENRNHLVIGVQNASPDFAGLYTLSQTCLPICIWLY